MELYIIRHAQSTNNALTDQRDRVEDPPLTALGLRQAGLLAEHLALGWQPITWAPVPVPDGVQTRGGVRGYGLTRLLCSPMLRSLQTAQPVAAALGLRPEVWIDIHEQGGMFLEEGEGEAAVAVGKSGLTRAAMQERFPNYVLPEAVTAHGWYSGGYEEWAACHMRAAGVAKALRAWAADGAGQVAIISHGGFADALLKALLHGGPSHNGHGPGFFYLHFNTAIDRIDIGPEGHVRVAFMNRVEHLPPDLLS